MSNNKSLYERIASSPFNSVVGGGDPMQVARAHVHILSSIPELVRAGAILDFGCGIGRTMPILFDTIGNIKLKLDGCDISSEFIDECRRIYSDRPFRFFKIAGQNEHYAAYNTSKEDDAVPDEYYDAAYSFSVFTHLDVEMAASVLKVVAKKLRPAGYYYFTLFRIDEEFIPVINGNASPIFKFNNKVKETDTQFSGRRDDKLAFAAIAKSTIERLLLASGFKIIFYRSGAWRGLPSENLHDAYLVQRTGHGLSDHV